MIINFRFQSKLLHQLQLKRSTSTTTFSNQITFAKTCTATVPSYTRHLILHHHHHHHHHHHQSINPSTWPSDLTTISPIYKTLQNLTQAGQSLQGLGLSLSSTSSELNHSSAYYSSDIIQEAYLHSAHDSIKIPFPISTSNLNEFIEFYKSLPTIEIKNQSNLSKPISPKPDFSSNSFYVYVCVHENRDCRCGIRGKPLLTKLKSLYQTQRSTMRNKDTNLINFFPISHIGGHKYAGNLIVYPSGNWFGLLDPMKDDVERILDCLLSLGTQNQQIWWDKWRGQIGLDKDLQWDLYKSGIRNSNLENGIKDQINTHQGPDIIVQFKTHQGEVLSLKGKIGEDLRSIAKRGEAPSIEATCGGNCECATCQIYINQTAPIPPPSENEEDMLFTAINRRDNSRLACQVILTPELATWLECQTNPQIQLPRF